MDGGRTVHRKRRGQIPSHQIDQDRRKAALDDVPAHGPDNRLTQRTGLADSVHRGAQPFTRQKPGQASEPGVQTGAGRMRPREIRNLHLAAAFFQRHRAQAREIDRVDAVTHRAALRRASAVKPLPERVTCSGVPVATTRPPPSPPSGPRSMTQSAARITFR